MLYIISKMAGLVATPSLLLLLLAGIGAFLTLRRAGSRWGRGLLITGLGGMVAFAVLPLGEWMIRPLEQRFPTPNPEHVDGIVLLGGGIAVDRSVDHDMPHLSVAGDRMTAFVMWARRYPQARLVFTGGNADPFVDKTSEAAIARRYFEIMGLGARRITYESKSRNTYENALFTKALVRPRANEGWLLITNACDLPRAVGSFRAVGWHIIPVPGGYLTGREHGGWLPGPLRGLMLADWAAHEWLGLIYYRARGWSSSLFPGPKP